MLSKYPREKQEAGAGAKGCIRCGSCEKACPQGIHIREDLETLARELGEEEAGVQA